MKKLLLFLIALSASIAILGCDGNTEEQEKIQIDFWHMSPVGSESYTGTKDIINAFNDSQDTYFVKGTGYGFWDYWDKIAVAISSRTAPDIGFSTIDDVPIRAEAGVLYNISDLIASDPDGIDIDELYQSQLDFATYEDDLYALPFSATTRVLYYNLDMFEAAGLTEADVPTTWSELETVAKLLDVVEGDEIQQLGFDPTYGNATYHGWLWQTGLDFFDDDLNPTLNTQGHIDVLQWMIDFNSEYSRSQLTAFGDANAMLGINPFAGERVAMIVEVDGLYQIIKNAGATFNYGVTQIPVPDEDGIRVNWGSGFSVEMYDNGKGEDDQKAGAWEFLKYLMSYDVQMELAEVNGWIMAHQGAMETVAEGNPILERLLEEVAYAVDKRYVPYAPSWHGNDWQPYYSQALEGELSAAEALEAARNNYLQKKANWEATHQD
ncbi:MAG: extracellular solute-binding protein [Bacilli bacterium]|nr:extracellular solute-binding protein [Bacilli bacterium]MBN2696402.1 extracellular solute-binding protein [Bacilli bacterium]